MRKMSKTKKILIITLLVLLFGFLFINKAFATLDLNQMKPDPPQNSETVVKKANKILGAVQVVGSIVSVVTLSVIGIKYMVGSVEEKAEYKKTMIPYIVGAILVFATSNLVKILYDFGQSINK